MSLYDLKPCPFCGETPQQPQCFVMDESQGTKYGFVACCGKGPDVRTGYNDKPDAPWHKDAADAWNHRVEQASDW